MSKAGKGGCEKCGRDLYQALRERRPKDYPYWSATLPTLDEPCPHITITRRKVEEFNADYSELAEFAAWCCGVDPKKFCRSDMMRATGAWKEIQRRIAIANGDEE